MEILNRTNAPFADGVWSVIDETMAEFLTQRLNLRSVIDFDDSYGYDTDAIATKELQNVVSKKDLSISVRKPLSMVEIKHSFAVTKDVIEDIKRGVEDFDDSSLQEAANRFATTENAMILQGIKEADIGGILASKEVTKVEANSPKDILSAVAKSLGILNKNFVDMQGLKLVVSSTTLAKLYTEFFDGISVKAKLDDILGANSIVVNDDIGDKNCLLVSQRGGDFTMYSGLDLALGFEKENKDSVTLFLIQLCSFKLWGPEAAVVIDLK